MKTLLYFLSEPVAVALGWTLLHALWQGFALVMPAALGMHLFRRNSSALRYNIGVGALLAQVIVSAVTFGWYYQPLLQTVRSSAKTVLTTALSAPIIWPIVSRSLPWHVQVQRFLEGHLTEIVVCWLVGVVLFLVRLAGGWFYIQRLKTTAVQPADAFWQAGLTRLSARLAIRQPVRVLESMQVLVPIVVGALKPVILLPVGLAAGLSMREAEAILAHELAHIKRFDYAVNFLQSIVEVAFFFHPALWWLSARVREERENCCDDLAVLACGDARSLAHALARVEEFSQTPMLAMALASQKKLLLNRVRRMLGVSARPVVSNAHLGMLTLATLLLTTISVYAMQEKEPQPKPRKTQPTATRRHKTSNGSEFSITDNRKVDYIIWKGRKLPAKRVAALQHQLDQVMAGQLSLDDVAQPDRDILLNIIEASYSSDEGKSAAADGLARIDYGNIVATTLNDASVNLDGMVEGLAKVDYNAVIQDAFAKLPHQPAANTDSLAQIREYHTHKMDSLSQLMAIQRTKADALLMQMEKMRFPVEELMRKQEILLWRKEKMLEQRNALIEKHQRLLDNANTGKPKLSQAEIEKQLSALEPEIKKQESSIEAWNQQVEALKAQQDEIQKPMDNLKRVSEQFEKEMNRLAEEIGRHGDVYGQLAEQAELPELPEVPEVNISGTARPLGAPRVPKSLKGTRIPRPAPATAPTINVRPAKPAVPAKAPKPALAPASNDNASLTKPYFQRSPTWFLKPLSKC